MNLDDALREWPEVEKTDDGLGGSAQSVDGAPSTSGEPGASVAYVSDENLLADRPLDKSTEDGHNSAATLAWVELATTAPKREHR